MSMEEARDMMDLLHDDWSLDEETESIGRHFKFSGFGRTMSFVNAVAFVATNEGHHPEMVVNYGTCDVQYRTHAIDGLSENDFICAAKIDRLADEL